MKGMAINGYPDHQKHFGLCEYTCNSGILKPAIHAQLILTAKYSESIDLDVHAKPDDVMGNLPVIASVFMADFLL